MPFWGLILTSTTFIIPTVVAYIKKRSRMTTTCSVLTVTSILYHGTHNLIFKWIDLCYAHSVACLYSIISIKKCILYHRFYDFIILSGVGGSIYIFYAKSCNPTNQHQDYWHMLMHIVSQGSWIMHALDSK
jgi:hypothetical protein